jgi:hypothetical protein
LQFKRQSGRMDKTRPRHEAYNAQLI